MVALLGATDAIGAVAAQLSAVVAGEPRPRRPTGPARYRWPAGDGVGRHRALLPGVTGVRSIPVERFWRGAGLRPVVCSLEACDVVCVCVAGCGGRGRGSYRGYWCGGGCCCWGGCGGDDADPAGGR